MNIFMLRLNYDIFTAIVPFSLAANDQDYGHLAFTVTGDVPFAGASLSQSEKVKAGANTAKCPRQPACAH